MESVFIKIQFLVLKISFELFEIVIVDIDWEYPSDSQRDQYTATIRVNKFLCELFIHIIFLTFILF